MAIIRDKIKGSSKVGQQNMSLRVTIPPEISSIIEINPGDTVNWVLHPDKEKPVLTIE